MNRRGQAEESYRKKFNEFGLSERFEFLRREWSMDHDKRFWCRCRACGKEFLSWNEVFKGRQKHLLCPNCGAASDGNDIWNRSPECESAMAYYAEGHTVKETAEKFSISEYQINNSVKVRGVSNGRQFGELSDGYKESARKESEQNIAKRLNSLGFDYVGGYVDRHGKVKIKCKSCGNTFERTADFAKKGNVVCRKCEHEKALIRQAERRKQQKIVTKRNAEARQWEKEWCRLLNPPKDYTDLREEVLNRVGVCKVCGKNYTVRDYVDSCGLKYVRDAGYCSAGCRDKHLKERTKISHKGRQDSHRHRALKFGCVYDSSVTLAKLIERDGLRCAICGEMCDQNDHSWSKYCGPMYPSIDHIIPMSKGGGHVWDNVQVAHIICNSEKGDSI